MKLKNIIHIGRTCNEVRLYHAKKCPLYFIENYLSKEKDYKLAPCQLELIKRITGKNPKQIIIDDIE